MKRTITLLTLALMLAAPLAGLADGTGKTYAVTITNLTKAQNFTPIIAATHSPDIAFFEAGQPAIEPLAVLAESGNPMPLEELLGSVPHLVSGTAINDGLLGPGQSATLMIQGHPRFDRLSLAAMLIPTNDTFVALDSVPLPKGHAMVMATAWDAGSEENDELCASIPGPPCFGEALSMADGEGFVHVANGIHGIGDVDAADYDWNGAVARVVVRRVR